jgi:cellulose synthase/poly-beta-1,6-N-acetylglucosamine synthase-like glycosyltransferase
VTCVIPCRNEADFIATCLESVAGLDWPKDLLEVLVCDGESTDRTVEILSRYAAEHPYIRVLRNPKRSLASGWNLGLAIARGEVVCTMIAHQTYEPDYIRASIRYLRKFDADGVGGGMRTRPQENTPIGRAISAAWSHPFGVGNAYFRIGTERPRWVDNIHCGVFRRDALQRVGGYNERLTRSQDADMQTRLRAAGGRLLLVPEVFSDYFTRSEFGPFARYCLVNGYWVARPLEHGAFLSSLRHWIPMLFVLSLTGLGLLSFVWDTALLLLVIVLLSYVMCSAAAGLSVALRRADVRYAVLLPVVFATLHFGYGLGTTAALLELGAGWLRHLIYAGGTSSGRENS